LGDAEDKKCKVCIEVKDRKQMEPDAEADILSAT
jgi:hypothetical protein